MKRNLRISGFIFPILLKMISFEVLQEINSLVLNYNLMDFYLNFFAKVLSRYIKNRSSINDIRIKIFRLF